MPTNCLFNRNPWNLLFTLGLVLGVCLFQPFGVSKAFALDSTSQIFDQGQNVKSNQTPSSQPLAMPEETPNPAPSLFGTLARLVLALAVTIALIMLTVWGLKWVWGKRGWNQLAEEGKSVRVLSSTYLAPRKTIHLVEVGKRILVVGVGSEEMTCLDIIREPEEVEALKNAAQQGFPKIFNRIVQRHDTIQQESENQRILEESSKVVGGYVAKLKNMKKKKNTPEQTDEK